MSGGHVFDVDTGVDAVGDNLFTATVTDRWNALNRGPNGGYVLAICLRALCAAVPFPDPLAVSAHFLRPARTGPTEVRTEVAHGGRRAGTGQASLFQEGAEVLRAMVTFGDLRGAAGRTVVLGQPPELPAPEDCIDPLGGGALSGFSLTDRVAFRTASLPGFLQGKPSGDPTMDLWLGFKEPRDPDLVSLVFFVDAAAPVVVELGELSSLTIALTVHLRAHPEPGWLAGRVATRHVIGDHHDEDFEVWDAN